MALSLGGCGGAEAETNENGEKIFNLKLGHNMAEDHAVHTGMLAFAEDVETRTNGSVKITIIPNGTLGSETDMISQIQNGALDFAKVPAAILSNFSDLYDAYSVPYVFNNQEHYYKVMDGPITQEIFEATAEDGFIGITWLDSGARSFYTADTAIRTPEDLKGLKIRTLDNQMSIDMMTALGGSATVMGYSEIYTGLQQGVVDGAENNITALRDHGEVAKIYSFDEHTRIPDVVVFSSKVWNEMSAEQQAALKEAGKQTSEDYKVAWKAFEDEVLEMAVNDFGVEFVKDVDIPAFQAAVQPIYEDLKANNPEVYAIVERIQAEAQ
ncbi:DctP family TRAP transporter solute receptor [Candidatus Epulonipiscium fishelsonii]|uniref:DctP family TRAP transporter solute receptor n=1 Tax=Candidatus Epulonipiscium fishelsonii TaxID=77094 RepID=A0ACC8X8S9_9FIRM|nr:DctP family TRAP transporter solute receptor [Epulopiscium sp. SCG-B05WGA-EpuloA1]ONI38548.1 DctP family TRAP transporter solute receptor [Epulopiscium sp. SCG-B11WGA-EpuloA1]